ncbi:ribose-5-phosphate isomerase RpiA [Candidatus Liberibacter asiaticus]|uniref:Ribose-5-phosphate isomerase A n=2 Tax=Liberibacter asiaticus TaxID=34021 RepID=C6XGM4_LIBAP|nr:ribose-5-phosphate isomerase RpiA [Candidatus Liberibacter asiaticus]ACT57527.1 ribose-5-phosphate isomerase A [Candidatus Liberibacter asiaticus str. psy62]AGH17290.1 ribose-5-phosphate isomerase A [Candidatus Liberibacter asiaticus str. gxpsy]ALK07582.1 ribose-5-phosphate isomerase RpiA [Candidatus Liberibacter asiaticus]ASK53073.1 ribose 5-phosphate isomerase A [Candidatus Liberibacter asiaticus]AWL14397.1 ribose-5-phosphate isomerase RpiA [Candidatus Liberibacter asiaticus]
MDALQMKRNAARRAIQYVVDGMTLGMGTGSTAKEFMILLADKIANGFRVQVIPSSRNTENFCKIHHIPLHSPEDVSSVDLSIDGFDEIDSRLRLIKGYGGALLREKIIAHAASRFIVIGDESKRVDFLGRGMLPIEIDQFGVNKTLSALKEVASCFGLNEELRLRRNGSGLFVSDGGNYIVDAFFGFIPDPQIISGELCNIPGVIEHGLFINMVDCAIIGTSDGECLVLQK